MVLTSLGHEITGPKVLSSGSRSSRSRGGFLEPESYPFSRISRLVSCPIDTESNRKVGNRRVIGILGRKINILRVSPGTFIWRWSFLRDGSEISL